MTEKKRRMTAEDLYNFQLVSDPQISPNGEYVVFCVQQVDKTNEKKYTNLWLVATDGGEPRQFTHGQQSDTHPRWSPDGKEIAFLSNRADEKQTQIYTIPISGGEARCLTEMQGDFDRFAWSPNGRKLLCQFRKKDAEVIEREADARKKELGIVVRHITRTGYKLDGKGYLPQERWHVWVVDAASGEAVPLTDGEFDENEPCWSPDGRFILFLSIRTQAPDLHPDDTELYLMPVEGGEMQKVAAHNGRKMCPAFSADGSWISYLGLAQRGKYYQNWRLYKVPVTGGEARNITAEFDLCLDSMTLGDIGGAPPLTPPVWSPDGRTIYCLATQKGDQFVTAVNPDDGQVTVEPITKGGGVAGQFSLDTAGEKLAHFRADMRDPGQIWFHELETGRSRLLTRFNGWLAEIDLGQVEEVWFTGPDDNPLHGWILTPPSFDSTRQHPSILEIHGGPHTQYGRFFMHEFYYLAAHDYVVYWSNPRGSQGYGEAHSGAIYNQYGTVDLADVMAWADYMEQQPYIDKARMGVTGGSYGGYMTSMLIGRTQRFKAAVAQRVVSNIISFYGSSDMNWQAEQLFGMEKPPWDDFANYWDQSPMKYVGNATTPTLIIHSEQDNRCHPEQGEQMFVALKRLGVDSELVLFPGEPHGLSRNGRTDRRVARLSHILRWFENYLGVLLISHTQAGAPMARHSTSSISNSLPVNQTVD